MAGPAAWFADAQKDHQARRFAEAEAHCRRIVDAESGHVGAWYHLGLACAEQDKLGEAVQSFERLLALAPTHADGLMQLGIMLGRQKQAPAAVERFRQAIAAQPEHAAAHNNLGVALGQMKLHDEALASFREAVRLRPNYVAALFNIAVRLAEMKRADEAIATYERILQLRPDCVDAYFNLGFFLLGERRTAEGVVLLQQAARLKPGSAEVHNNLCLALADLGRFDEALASCDQALRLRPSDAKSHMNRGNVLAGSGRYHEALACYAQALRLRKDYATARWNRSLSWLAVGDYERGWPEYEWRWKRKETKKRVLPKPRWEGEALDGKTILLWCEQGMGDMIQFVRYAGLAKERGATVILECPACLVSLLGTCAGVDRCYAEGSAPPEFDCHAPLMSLPYLCGTTLSTVPDEVPYLSADPAQVERWREELNVGQAFLPACVAGRQECLPQALKIGITWQGNPRHRWDQHRSFSGQFFRPLARLEGVELYSLQKGMGVEQLKTMRFPVTDLSGRIDELGGTFHETAAAIGALDLVITCDSAVAHLAGALGLKVWVVMSALSDWRWLQERDDSPWYPTMQLFRQTKLGEWRPVFERICGAVRALRKTA